LHRELLLERDAKLAELDRLRAEAAHHRAYLQHHGRDAFDWGDFRRTDPVSRDWGYDRGVPIDRRYIDDFLSAHSSDVRGDVLEVQEDDFTIAFGGPRVTHHDILDIDRSNPRATVLADLRCAPAIQSATYDCIILTQTLHVIDGVGRVQARGGPILEMRAGDTVRTDPGEWHWHGSAPDRFMTHLAIWEAPPQGDETTWADLVTDDEYAGPIAEI
jgi:hypothetical protein